MPQLRYTNNQVHFPAVKLNKIHWYISVSRKSSILVDANFVWSHGQHISSYVGFCLEDCESIYFGELSTKLIYSTKMFIPSQLILHKNIPTIWALKKKMPKTMVDGWNTVGQSGICIISMTKLLYHGKMSVLEQILFMKDKEANSIKICHTDVHTNFENICHYDKIVLTVLKINVIVYITIGQGLQYLNL